MCARSRVIKEIYDIVSDSGLPSRIFPEILNRKKKLKFENKIIIYI